jgi:hypothetical protein
MVLAEPTGVNGAPPRALMESAPFRLLSQALGGFAVV